MSRSVEKPACGTRCICGLLDVTDLFLFNTSSPFLRHISLSLRVVMIVKSRPFVSCADSLALLTRLPHGHSVSNLGLRPSERQSKDRSKLVLGSFWAPAMRVETQLFGVSHRDLIWNCSLFLRGRFVQQCVSYVTLPVQNDSNRTGVTPTFPQRWNQV